MSPTSFTVPVPKQAVPPPPPPPPLFPPPPAASLLQIWLNHTDGLTDSSTPGLRGVLVQPGQMMSPGHEMCTVA
jgi:hypothetical protein